MGLWGFLVTLLFGYDGSLGLFHRWWNKDNTV